MSGDYYTTLTDNELRIELYNLACRAIAAFKFPKFPLDYDAKYTKHTTSINHKDVEEEVTAADDWNDIHPFFTSDEVTYREIEVIIAWMKVYWAEEQASNADNYVDIYTDSNIKTFLVQTQWISLLSSIPLINRRQKNLKTAILALPSPVNPH